MSTPTQRTMPHHGRCTPWGVAQTCETLADGIASVSTASHGGFCLSYARAAKMPFGFETFAGGKWYEEDEDVCAVIIAFPDDFSGHQVAGAVAQVRATAKHSPARWSAARVWLESGAAYETRRKAAHWTECHADMWQRGGMCSDTAGWNVNFRRVRDGARQWRHMPDYPEKAIYSDAELDAMQR